MQIKTFLRLCPVCNNTKGSVLHTQNFSLPEKSILPTVYDVVSCEQCGFCFADTSASQKDYDQYYNQMSKYEDKETASGGGLNRIDKARLTIAADIIEQNFNDKNASILDIGCANGGLLQCLDEKGYSNLTGIDITKVCIENVKKSGYSAHFGGVFNFEELGDRTFDVVILSHVLEHLHDLQQTAVNLKKLLKPNGIIYIEVPNAAQYPNYFVVPFYYFDCEHINHFDIQALKNLFEDDAITCVSSNVREVNASETTMYPVASAVFKKNYTTSKSSQITKSVDVLNSIVAYVEQSKEKSNFSEIELLIKMNMPVLIWGAGMYTLRLLENSPLKNCNIICFMDKDFKKQGNRIHDIIIKNPISVLADDKESTVVIASALHGKAIKEDIINIDGNSDRKTIIL